MAELIKVVARFTDGTLLKGTTADFAIGKPLFHMNPAGGGPAVPVTCRSLKALFFVKDFKGGPHASGLKGFAVPAGNASGKKIAVLFQDGELLCGYTLAYVPGREGFFMFPADGSSNNIRIFVVNAFVDEVRVGPEAEDLANRVKSERSRAAMKV